MLPVDVDAVFLLPQTLLRCDKEHCNGPGFLTCPLCTSKSRVQNSFPAQRNRMRQAKTWLEAHLINVLSAECCSQDAIGKLLLLQKQERR